MHQINPHYGDVYSTGGQPEKHYVFVEGNHLPQRFRNLQPNQSFCIAELGFGLGLAFHAALACWQTHAPTSAHLHFVSFEKYPATPQTQNLAPGWHTIETTPAITLHLFIGDATHGLATLPAQFHHKIDAWFLDGHDPRKNPDLWTPHLLQTLATHTAPGGTASSYSVAGHVRRALQTAGFTVTRTPGFPPKHEMLQATLHGTV